MDNRSKLNQIKVLLIVLCTSLGGGVLIALSMLYYYNPSGSYQPKNMLLDADRAFSLHFSEPGPKAKSDKRYVFDEMSFSYFNPKRRQILSIPVPKEAYAKLYRLIANDESLIDPDAGILSLFNRTDLAVLALKVHPVGTDSASGINFIFSEIDFVMGGDYYRIQLRQSEPSSGWIYFYHPQIYQKAHNLLDPTL